MALERLAAQLPPALGRVIIATFGNPAREITAMARRIGADLIVMGTHGHTMIGRLFRRSIAEKVVGAAPCPVLALPPDALAEASDRASQAA
jgi:nucleotide-binding universal stress UspA family protein